MGFENPGIQRPGNGKDKMRGSAMKHQQKLRIGHLSTMYHTAFILLGTDLLAGKGIEAEWTLFPSGPDIINAMEAGMIDLAYIGLPPVIIGIDRGLPLTCIAGGHIEGTVMIAGESARVLGECKGMDEFLRQFSGSAIGCPPRGSIHDVIVNELLRGHGITGIEVKNYAWADLLPDAVREGEIAAAAGTPALAVAGRRYSATRLAVPPDLLWPFNPSYSIVVLKSLLGRPDQLLSFLAAHEGACEMIRHDPGRAAGIVAETTGMVGADYVLETYRISPKYCAALPPDYRESTVRFGSTLHRLGYTSRIVGEEEIFDTSLIDTVHPGPHHYLDGLIQV
jgi:NitT/TauT family transport system substrate-binding protein